MGHLLNDFVARNVQFQSGLRISILPNNFVKGWWTVICLQPICNQFFALCIPGNLQARPSRGRISEAAISFLLETKEDDCGESFTACDPQKRLSFSVSQVNLERFFCSHSQ
jgi:hypothetical protein